MTAVPQLAHKWSARDSVTWWGVLTLCATEGALFAYFIAAYLYLGVTNTSWPPPGIPVPELALPLFMSGALFTSSLTLVLADRAFARGTRSTFRMFMMSTIALGLTFLVVQLFEYRDALRHAGPTAHAYASMFFTITGFHGVHVLAGVALLSWTLVHEMRGNMEQARPVALKNTSLYWHFVDGVWAVILTVLYVGPRFYR